jgi:sugar O-acyltransferase (sialic acid O-acetyltransferase NeuD family)
MKRLIIIGAGGFGREVLEWAQHSTAYRREWTIAGFLDDCPDCLDRFKNCAVPVIGNTKDYQPRKEDVFLCAIGIPRLRQEMRQRFENKGAAFTRLVHESCVIGSRVDLAPGVILCPGVVLTCDIHIGANSAINVNSAIGHDAVVGSDCQISSFCDITGYVKIGNGVLLGSRASIIPGKQVGDRAVVGAGSVVVSDVPPDVTVFGNPARLLARHD